MHFTSSSSPRGALAAVPITATSLAGCPGGVLRRRRDEELRPPGDAGQHVGGEQGGSKAQGEPFSFAPCNTLGEESISPSDQVTGVGSPWESGSQNHPQRRITIGKGSPPWTEQGGMERLGPNTITADLVGPMPNEKRHCRPHLATATKATCRSSSHSADNSRSSAYN